MARQEEAYERDRENQLMGRFFESHEADESDVYKSERYTSPKKSSPSWPKDLYYERIA